jgi:5-formyltetrahydrofolate cyclo-ligase
VALDPDERTASRRLAKVELRKLMRARRSSTPAETCALLSEKIVARVAACAPFARATKVGLFWPMLERHEVDVRPLFEIAHHAKKAVFFPFFEAPGEMTLRSATPETLTPRGNGFAEPPEGSPAVQTDSGLVIVVPALAVDLSGHRIGYGAGFYDRLLAKTVPPAFSIAVAYDFQLLADLPATETDQRVAMVITDARSCGVP